MHFGAMYSQKYSHRDLPMKNEAVLQVLMQTSEFETRPEQWGGAMGAARPPVPSGPCAAPPSSVSRRPPTARPNGRHCQRA